MMRLLLDECVDSRLAKEFQGVDVKTVFQINCAGVKNGELLALAEKEFDVFITVDRNLSFQQHLPKFDIAVILLHAKTNALADLSLLIPKILAILPDAKKGSVTHVS
jgi:hypothetical protein